MVKFLTRLKTKKTFIIIVFIIVLIFIYFYNNITNNELKTRNKQLSYLNEFDTYVAIGVLDDNGNLIDDGNTINMSNNNTWPPACSSQAAHFSYLLFLSLLLNIPLAEAPHRHAVPET